MNNARLIVAVITNILWEAVIIAVIIFGLPRLGILIPLWGIIIISFLFLVYAVFFYQVGSRILRKKPLAGFSNMTGTEGRVTSTLNPNGFVRIGGELWAAKAESGSIEIGAEVLVLGQNGLKLIVRRK